MMSKAAPHLIQHTFEKYITNEKQTVPNMYKIKVLWLNNLSRSEKLTFLCVGHQLLKINIYVFYQY